MKTAIDTALELTAAQEDQAALSKGELPYEHARKIAEATGKSVVEVQDEHRRKQAPITPLAKALTAQSAAQARCEEAAGLVSEAMSLQDQFEALVTRRASIRAILARGQEMLNQSLDAIEGLKQDWLNWHIIEEQSPGKMLAVYQSVASLAMHEKIVAMMPAWQENQSGQLHQVTEQLARFEREHGFKAR